MSVTIFEKIGKGVEYPRSDKNLQARERYTPQAGLIQKIQENQEAIN